VKELDKQRAMVAVQPIGIQMKDKDGERGLRIYINAFFPTSFRGVMELEQGDLVRVSARITAMDEIPDTKGQNNTVLRLSLHGYSITQAWVQQSKRTNVAEEMGAA
jgi:hypothetical protein